LALIAFLVKGSGENLNKAKLLADAFVFAQGHDCYFKDERLRNAIVQKILKTQKKALLAFLAGGIRSKRNGLKTNTR